MHAISFHFHGTLYIRVQRLFGAKCLGVFLRKSSRKFTKIILYNKPQGSALFQESSTCWKSAAFYITRPQAFSRGGLSFDGTLYIGVQRSGKTPI